jgi:hypothetical protein
MRHFPEHEVTRSYSLGWHTKGNGELLSLVESQFDVFLTTDQNLRYQQNLAGRSLRLIVLVAGNNKYESLAPLIPKVKETLAKIMPGELVEIS